MRTEDAKRATRAPRVAAKARAIDTIVLARNLTVDPRFLSISGHGERLTLTTAALHFTDRAGRFWPKLESLARKAGVSRATAARAVSNAATLGLLTIAPYLRPDGKQGSSTYRFASELLTRQGVSSTTHGSDTTGCLAGDSPDKGTHQREATGCLTSDPPIEEVLEETLPRGVALRARKKKLAKEQLAPKERRLFEAFAKALGFSPRLPREVEKWCRAVVDLARINATEEQVLERVSEARHRGWSTIGPTGIAGAWDGLNQPTTTKERETTFEPSTFMADL